MSEGGFVWRQNVAVRVLVPRFFDDLGLAGGYSTRSTLSGESLDLDFRGSRNSRLAKANRALVAQAMGVNGEHLVVGEQVHGPNVAAVSFADRGKGAGPEKDVICGADGLVTTAAALPLAGLAADCAIILMAGDDGRCVAAVHSGRKGTLLNIAGAAIRLFSEMGAAPESLYASIGPCIEHCCYEVGAEVRREYESAFTWGGEVFRIFSGRTHLDMSGAITRQLVEAGVRPERIFGAGLCTSCRNDLFFSYRREGDRAGRCAGVIAIGKK